MTSSSESSVPLRVMVDSSMTTIHVHAQFPLSTEPEHYLDSANWKWVYCLAFPTHELNDLQFTSRPYKWIRYATGVVIGAHGHLCYRCDLPSPTPIDYESDLPTESINLYYTTTDEEKCRLFTVDTAENTETETSSTESEPRVNFREGVLQRDGERCVLTGSQKNACNVIHLLPPRKGDRFIESLTARRSRDPSGKDIIRNTNDVRNGMLLTSIASIVLGQCIAIFVTPNFAMDTSDVNTTSDSTEEKLIAHLFAPVSPGYIESGSEISGRSDKLEWPPTVLLEVVYASAVIHSFGVCSVEIDSALEKRDYLLGATEKHRRTGRKRIHLPRANSHSFDTYDMVFVYPFIAMPPEEVRQYVKRREETVAGAKHKTVEENVNAWNA